MVNTGQGKNSYGPQMGLFTGSDTRESFLQFHQQYPQVYTMFKRFALHLLKCGREKIGSKMIIERIRWEVTTNSKDEDGFKINNNYTPHYSRLFMQDHPQYGDCFYTKNLKK